MWIGPGGLGSVPGATGQGGQSDNSKGVWELPMHEPWVDAHQ